MVEIQERWIGAEEIPLRYAEQNRVLRVGGTRVPIDTVIYHFKQSTRPEEIVDSFPSLKLADVYLVVGYYLRHQQEIDAYLEKRERKAEEIERWVRTWSKQPSREELLARLKAKSQGNQG